MVRSNYRRIICHLVDFKELEIEDPEFGHASGEGMDDQLRSVMGEMINHAERTGCREYKIIVKAKKKEVPP